MPVTPYLMVPSATELIAFVRTVLDAEIGAVVPLAEGSDQVVHGEARIAGGTLYFGDIGPDGNRCQPLPVDPPHLQLWLDVANAESAQRRAVEAGAVPVVEVAADDTGARMGGFVAFGVLWWVHTPA